VSKLKRIRRLTGMSQHELAKATDIPVMRIVYAETNRIQLKKSERERVQSVLRERAQRAMDAVSS
jgi:hypothetical protein